MLFVEHAAQYVAPILHELVVMRVAASPGMVSRDTTRTGKGAGTTVPEGQPGSRSYSYSTVLPTASISRSVRPPNREEAAARSTPRLLSKRSTSISGGCGRSSVS